MSVVRHFKPCILSMVLASSLPLAAIAAPSQDEAFLTEQELRLVQESLPVETQLDLLVAQLEQQVMLGEDQEAMSTVAEIRTLDVPAPPALMYFEGTVLLNRGKIEDAQKLLDAYLRETGNKGTYTAQANAGIGKINAELARREAERQQRLRDFRRLNASLANHVKRGDGEKAMATVKVIREFGLPVPDAVTYFEGEALLLLNRPIQAKSRLLQYIDKHGRDGEHYKRAIRLFAQATQVKQSTYIRQVQRELRRLGYKPGNSGEVDSPTRKAIAGYQNANKMTVTGNLTPDLLRRLRTTSPKVHDCDRYAAHAGDPKRRAEGIAFNQIDVSTAIASCKEAVENYPSVARYQFQYGRSLDAAKRKAEAVDWYRKASQLGYPSAMASLGNAYERGRGVFQNTKKAVTWYQKASDLGLPRAQVALANMYETGIGVRRDFIKARTYFRKAAKQGNNLGQYRLGRLYERGEGGSKNIKRARTWYQKAAAADYQPAILRLKTIGGSIPTPTARNSRRNQSASASRPANTAKFKEKVRIAQIRLSNLGYKLGKADGIYGAKTAKAIKKFQRNQRLPITGEVTDKLLKQLKARQRAIAATVAKPNTPKPHDHKDDEHGPDDLNLDILSRPPARTTGNTTRRTTATSRVSTTSVANRCDELAASPNDPASTERGVPVSRINAAKAMAACRDAVRAYPRSPRFASQYGRALLAGGEYSASAIWFSKAASRGYADGQYNLAVQHEKGLGVKKDFTKAVKLYKQAAGKQHSAARNSLTTLYRAGFIRPKNAAERRELESYGARTSTLPSNTTTTSSRPTLSLGASSSVDTSLGNAADMSPKIKKLTNQAMRGNTDAQFSLGQIYLAGKEVSLDYKKAVEWFRKAAVAGHRGAQNKMGYMYEHGYGVPMDISLALTWYRRATE